MLAKDADRLNALRMLKSAVGYVQIEKKTDALSDADFIAVVQREVKKRRDSVEQFTAGGRSELAAKEEAEIPVLETFLPKPSLAGRTRSARAGHDSGTRGDGQKTDGRGDQSGSSQSRGPGGWQDDQRNCLTAIALAGVRHRMIGKPSGEWTTAECGGGHFADRGLLSNFFAIRHPALALLLALFISQHESNIRKNPFTYPEFARCGASRIRQSP